MARSSNRWSLSSSDAQYVIVFFGGMFAFWIASWVSDLIPARYFAEVDVLNLVTLIVTLLLYVGVMIPFAGLLRALGVSLGAATTVLGTLVSGLFGFVFLATIGQIYNDSGYSTTDAAILKLAVAAIFGIFYAIGWWTGQHYNEVARRRRAR